VRESAAILYTLALPGTSSSIDARSGRIGKTEGCKITDVKREKGGVTFTRLDDALVFPIQPAARPALAVTPVVDDLDRYLLQVTNLPAGTYQVNVNGTPLETVSQADLSDGVNLANFDSPLMDQGQQILAKVYDKNNLYFNEWRNVSLGKDPDDVKQSKIADLSKQIQDDEDQINELRKPKAFQISVVPLPQVQAPAVTP
jgi:hypothetical protein